MKPGTPCPLWLPTRLPVRGLQAQGSRPGTSPSCVCPRALAESLLGPEVGGDHRISDEWGAVSLPLPRELAAVKEKTNQLQFSPSAVAEVGPKCFGNPEGGSPRRTGPVTSSFPGRGTWVLRLSREQTRGSGEQSCSQEEFGWTRRGLGGGVIGADVEGPEQGTGAEGLKVQGEVTGGIR